MSSSNIKHYEQNKVQTKNSIQALHTENTVLLKRIETIENTNQNLIALTAIMTKNFKESKERDIMIMDMLKLIKDDYKEIISEKVTEQQEVKHLIYNEQEYDEFFKDETFKNFFNDQIQKNSIVLEY
jgi:hypothetical protein